MRLRIFSALMAVVAAVALAHAWTPLRTADGQPDLQGYWTNATFTPLERPAELAGKEFLTEAEAAAYEKQQLLRARRWWSTRPTSRTRLTSAAPTGVCT